MDAAAGIHTRPKDLSELKRQALSFYKTNKDVPRKVEDALNTLFFESPYDIYGYLVCL
jgi:enolase